MMEISFMVGSTNKKIHMQLKNHVNSALPVMILDGSFEFHMCVEKQEHMRNFTSSLV